MASGHWSLYRVVARPALGRLDNSTARGRRVGVETLDLTAGNQLTPLSSVGPSRHAVPEQANPQRANPQRAND